MKKPHYTVEQLEGSWLIQCLNPEDHRAHLVGPYDTKEVAEREDEKLNAEIEASARRLFEQ